jgi:hypothetical protein
MKRLNRIGLVKVFRCGSFLSLTMLLWLSVAASADQSRLKGDSLLDASEYRSELEEVVVVGQEPEWRKNINQKEEWRPQRFKLSSQSSSSRIEWFPEYTKDERDNYNGVRDRMGEKADFQLFKMKF